MAPKRMPVKTKNPLSLLCQRAEKRVMSDLLSTSQRARRMAVMMICAMSVVKQNHERTE
jgi:hypothetical protein